MKRIIYCLFFLMIVSCKEKPMDVNEAKRVAEELILKIDAEDFDTVETLYTPEFNASEPMEAKKAKLLQLKNIMGAVKNMEFVKSENVAEFGQPAKVILEYKIFHTKITSVETLTVIEEEGGYKVSSHLIKSEGN